MSQTLETLAANMRHAALNRESVTIGGGVFSPDELKAGADALYLAAQMPSLSLRIDALKDKSQNAFEWNAIDLAAKIAGRP